jgi:hypothetical protein
MFGGTPDTERDYVSMITIEASPAPNVWLTVGLCSGTLVAPTVVVTAAHCTLVPPGFPFPVRYSVSNADVVSFVPNRPAAPGVLGTVVAHPDFCVGSAASPCEGGPEGFTNNDLAVVLLDSPLPGPYATLPKPKSVERAYAQPAPATVAGYGIPMPGVRQSGTAVAAVDPAAPDFLKFAGATPPYPCRGDSGGAVLDGATLLAVISVGDTTCNARTFAYRLDQPSAFSFLNKYVQGAPSSSDKHNR